jgi:tetratricopeptide (TPR) repeat protein
MQHMAKRSTAALADAEILFRRAIDLDATFTLAYVGLADTLTLQTENSAQGREAKLAEAERLVTRALEVDANLAEAWAAAGIIASSRMQLERSEEMFRRAIALNPNYAPAHHWLAFTLYDLGRRDEALAAAERAVVLDPLSAMINNNLGIARMNVGRFSDAQAAFGRAIEIDPTLAFTYVHIGNVSAYGLGRLDTAISWYEKAAELDPGSPEVLSRPIIAHWELGDDVGAGQWLSQLLALGEGTAFSNLVASLVYLERRDELSARRHAQLAADLDPWTLFLIRDHDLRKGDYVTARERYVKAFPELFDKAPMINERSAFAAIDLALLLQHTGQDDQASVLLDRSEGFLRKIPRKGPWGSGISDVAIFALRGDSATALAKLREAERAGWRGPLWRYYRDIDPNLASIRNEPEFKEIFADIERDMARQRAALAARPKDAPLDLAPAH